MKFGIASRYLHQVQASSGMVKVSNILSRCLLLDDTVQRAYLHIQFTFVPSNRPLTLINVSPRLLCGLIKEEKADGETDGRLN
ncbi:uncharacterized protein LOC124321158 isoform X2 [Daphnia pulicaria]|uniref:uncharacterized protein LOC124321158 isoform X2 n=1 Tax=Daphnia pulicaria TaxID=35523 RepID=UPI001EECB73F|nr:uncharacterized protein LOC124321158 isoform X2 [Daphnia pulicaria]